MKKTTSPRSLIEKIKAITTYPWDVNDGKIVACNLVKLAVKRFFDFLERDDMYFDVDAVNRVINFTEKLKHFTGAYNGKPFILMHWQKFIYMNVYGWKWKKNNLRVTRTFILSVGRKNGKSSLLSAMELYALLEEHGASCVCAANSANQAKILFNMASQYLKSIDKKGKHFKRYRDRIIFDKTGSEIKVVSSDASRLDGLNCSFFVEDETAAACDSQIWDILESSQGSRQQPLACSCTTRGFQLSGFYKQLEDSAIEVLNGIKEDDTLFTLIYTLNDGDDWRDENNWLKSCPNLNVSVSKEYLQQQVTKAKNNITQEFNIKTKIFNMWVTSSDTWVKMNYIYEAMQAFEIADFEDSYCYLSFDLASVCDLTALCMMVENDGKYYFKNWYFLPSASIENNPNSEKYKRWGNQGYLTITDGNVTDYTYVENIIMQIQEICPIMKIGYDQWNATDLAIRLTENGLPLTPYSQSLQSMNLPTKILERWLLQGKVVIDKNPITAWCYENAKTKIDWNDNVRIVKNTNMQKIDGTICHIMATGVFVQDGNADMSISVANY